MRSLDPDPKLATMQLGDQATTLELDVANDLDATGDSHPAPLPSGFVERSLESREVDAPGSFGIFGSKRQKMRIASPRLRSVALEMGLESGSVDICQRTYRSAHMASRVYSRGPEKRSRHAFG